MPGPFPRFWSQPIRYIKWAAYEKPALFYSTVVGIAGPISLLFWRPVKTRYFGWEPRPMIPTTYPMPTGQRQIPEGYGDDTEDQ